jgi:hypothetical protein
MIYKIYNDLMIYNIIYAIFDIYTNTLLRYFISKYNIIMY